MSRSSRLLVVLQLFENDRPVWTVEQISRALGISASTAYRHVRDLVQRRLSRSGHRRRIRARAGLHPLRPHSAPERSAHPGRRPGDGRFARPHQPDLYGSAVPALQGLRHVRARGARQEVARGDELRARRRHADVPRRHLEGDPGATAGAPAAQGLSRQREDHPARPAYQGLERVQGTTQGNPPRRIRPDRVRKSPRDGPDWRHRSPATARWWQASASSSRRRP